MYLVRTCVPSSKSDGFHPWHRKVESATLFSHTLHMHENGRRLQTRQYRNDSSGNEVLIHATGVEYYSFEQAAGHTVFADANSTIQVGGLALQAFHPNYTHTHTHSVESCL